MFSNYGLCLKGSASMNKSPGEINRLPGSPKTGCSPSPALGVVWGVYIYKHARGENIACGVALGCTVTTNTPRFPVFFDEPNRHPFSIRTLSHGSPALMECWTDETANFELKAMAVASHRSVWHARLLSSWRARTDHESKRRRLA